MIGRADILAPIGSLLDAWGIDRLDAPERLPWLLGLTALCLWWAARRPQPALLWPAASQLPARGAGSRRAARWLPLASRAVALGLLALALCDPVALRTLPPESGPGLDVLLVLDASGSMASVDARGTADQPLQRIDVARAAVGRFAAHRIDEGDRVGLVVFGAHAFTQCPLTHDAALLGDALGRVEVGVAGDATALGDALALAVRRVERAGGGEGQAVVLLTDGQSNAGDVPVSVALELARAAAVRVYTVAIGRAGNADLRAAVQRAGHGDADAAPPPAREALAELARATGGVAFDATGERDLAAVYAAIDALERAPRPRPARTLDRPSSEALLLGAGLLIFTELGLLRILRRRLPE